MLFLRGQIFLARAAFSALIFSAACQYAHGNPIGDFFKEITGGQSESSSSVLNVAALPTRNEAYTGIVRKYIQEQGLQDGSVSGYMAIIGNPLYQDINYRNLTNDIVPLIRKFGVISVGISDSHFQNVKYQINGVGYIGSMNGGVALCNSQISSCKFYKSFVVNGQLGTAEADGSFVALNMLAGVRNDSLSYLREVKGIKQVGLSGKNRIYIFFDPDCSACLSDFRLIQSKISELRQNYPNVSLEWVPTDIFRARKSEGRAEQALVGGFPALLRDFDRFKLSTETGGLPNTLVPHERNKIAFNVAVAYFLASVYGLNGSKYSANDLSLATPTVIYVKDGQAVVTTGFPSLSRIFSTVNSK